MDLPYTIAFDFAHAMVRAQVSIVKERGMVQFAKGIHLSL